MRNCWVFLLIFLPFSAPAQDMARVRKNIETLCAPEMHGRGYVNKGDKKAAEFLQKQFEKVGLKPFHGDYFQTFSLPVNTVLETELKLDGEKLKPGLDFIPDAAIRSGKGKLKILPLDTLIYSDEKRGALFLNQNLKSKAILVPEKFWIKRSILPDVFAQKMQTAGAVLISHPQKLTYTVAKNQNPQPQFDLLQKTVGKTPQKVKYEVKANFIPDYQTQNVIGFIPGKTQPDSFLVFTAHYDHLGRIDENTYFPGANDNASGTSLLLELAHYYAQPENQPDYSVVFMAFGAEEAGLVGSRFYVENPFFPLLQIKFLVNLDLTGTGEAGLMVVNGRIHEKEFAQLQQLNKQKNYFPEIKSRGKAANSDHFPFSEKGVPAFFFYTLGGTTAYHDVNDKPETLPLTRFPELFRLLLDFTRSF
ncbi:M28 family peptidase [Adhaeribacter sp. BT258]|uniref:M28 family peptidase n=1 Tax=Adhaeribacter terrigena TaxID=2793070 RepID=A0ABS1BWR8_9BACT|nr:M28 family peptidase [Adhaeribacter terrigena]MBK0401578.1 M28 family peptidase [Adhaeribacter terrigena]